MIKKITSFLHASRIKLCDSKKYSKKYLAFGIILLTAGVGAYATYSWVTRSQQQNILKTVPTEIKGNLITLKLLKEEYFIDFHNMFSQTARKALEFPEAITLNYTINYLHYLKRQADTEKTFLFCIFDNKDNKLIGDIEIRNLNDTDPGQFGTWINENYWGGGRFQEALDLISKAYFQLKPHEKSYIAHVRLWNKRSYHALKKYGFQDVGYFYEDGKPARYIMELKRP